MISVKLKCVCLIWYMGIAAVIQGQSVSDFPTSKKCVNPREHSNEVSSWQSLKSFENSLRSENDLISSSESSNAHSLMIALSKRIPSQEKPISRLRLGKLPHKRPKTAQTCKTALSLPLRTQQLMLIEIPDQTNQHLSKNTHGAFNEPMKYDIPLKGSQGFESDDKKAQRSESSSTGANEIPTVEEPPKRLHRRWEATPKTNFDRTTVGNYFLELCSEKKAEGDVIHTVVNTPHSRDVDRSEVGPECDLKAWNPEVHPDQNSFKIPITNYGICQTIDPQNSYEDVRKCGTPFQNLLNSQKENIPSHTPLSDTVGRVFAPRDIGWKVSLLLSISRPFAIPF
ncbi:uncharacterized protein [Bemisia tabaci]|uniref:uncharacterized protein n=1 Tax=Bemisia tabaci TaxID=7038 RepID=UPI003B2826CD